MIAFKLPTTQSYHRPVWEPAAPARRKTWLNRTAANVKVRWNQMRERRRVIRERQDMSDRDLADIGHRRGDVPLVFDPESDKEREA